jgi:hypothetical protein
LLVHASVQKELGLSAEYIQEFAEVTQKRRDLIRKMRTTNVCETYQDFHDLLVHEKIMGERLSPAQQKRLFEICLQARGALSLLDPVITESLNLDDDQIVEFANIRNYVLLHELAIVLSPTSARPQYKIEGDAVKVHARILSVLNAVQAAQWQTMQGEPFQFETLAAVTVSMPSEPAVE